jgi:hypothetical protein
MKYITVLIHTAKDTAKKVDFECHNQDIAGGVILATSNISKALGLNPTIIIGDTPEDVAQQLAIEAHRKIIEDKKPELN